MTWIPQFWLAAAIAGVGSGPPAPGLEAAARPRSVAIVVGIDTYPFDATLADLRFAGADARAISQLFEDEGMEVWPLVGNVRPETFWAHFSQATATAQRDDLVVVYFAGHAQLRPEASRPSGLQLLFSDSMSGDPDAGISIDALSTAMDDLTSSKKVVIIDACYSRRTQEYLQQSVRGPVMAPALPPGGRFEAWLYAAAPEQSAQEDEDLQHGVFTYYLLDALAGPGDLDGDGIVGVLEAFSYAGERTAAHTRFAQVPRISADWVGWRDLPLVGAPKAPLFGVLPWMELDAGAWQVWMDGAPRGAGAVTLGYHDIRTVAASGDALKSRVFVKAGDVLQISDAGVVSTMPTNRVREEDIVVEASSSPVKNGAVPTNWVYGGGYVGKNVSAGDMHVSAYASWMRAISHAQDGGLFAVGLTPRLGLMDLDPYVGLGPVLQGHTQSPWSEKPYLALAISTQVVAIEGDWGASSGIAIGWARQCKQSTRCSVNTMFRLDFLMRPGEYSSVSLGYERGWGRQRSTAY